MPNLSEEILKGLSMNPAYLGFLEDAGTAAETSLGRRALGPNEFWRLDMLGYLLWISFKPIVSMGLVYLPAFVWFLR